MAIEDELLAVAPPDVAHFTADEYRNWLTHATRLVDSATWEGARGVEVTDRMRHAIAAYAALLTAGFDPGGDPHRNVVAIVVHTGTIVTREEARYADGTASDGPRYLAGQSGHGRGPLLLDWRTFRREVDRPWRGQNVVFHEFAHKLDQLDGVTDGVPPLPDRAARERWEQTMGTNFRRLGRRGSDGLLRAYGATDPAEFFAVASEVFFTRPVELVARHPRVYDRLAEFYRQHPAARLNSLSPPAG